MKPDKMFGNVFRVDGGSGLESVCGMNLKQKRWKVRQKSLKRDGLEVVGRNRWFQVSVESREQMQIV
jgi:hypothetical protein